MGHRGRETQVTCEKCGRTVRRDKAVFIEKAVFTNPLDRNQVFDESYRRVLMREVAYCPSCGKHGRIYEKKKQQQERQRERNQQFGFRPRFDRPRQPQQSSTQTQPTESSASQEEKTA